MNKIQVLFVFLFFTLGIYNISKANLIIANPSNYLTFLSTLLPGDTLYLTAGNYTDNLPLNGIHGTALRPIVIMGSPNLYTTVFHAESCCNTISITLCSYLIIKNLRLIGANIPVDAVKGEGTNGNWAHHITLEYLDISGYGNNQQIVGISTKCHAWNWVIRKNRITGAGTGIYLGNSDGDKPFVNGLIENNLIQNTIGYNMEIKHQTDAVRDKYAGTAVNGKTIIRHNVFCKESGGSTGANARPNLLVGGFPLSGFGKDDYYEIYGNFFYQNPSEALFQGTGNIMLYDNIFVNHSDPAGYRAVYIRDQNGVQPQNIKVFHNTIWALNSSGGIRLFNPNSSYEQYCYANAVFAPLPVTNFINSLDNVTDAYANASKYVMSATANLSTLNLYPQSGQLAGVSTPDSLFQSLTNWEDDFNGDQYNWIYRGAYSGCCVNKGWQLQLDTMPSRTGVTTIIHELMEGNGKEVYPNPTANTITLTFATVGTGIDIFNLQGQRVFQCDWDNKPIDISFLSPGVYLLRAGKRVIKILKK